MARVYEGYPPLGRCCAEPAASRLGRHLAQAFGADPDRRVLQGLVHILRSRGIQRPDHEEKSDRDYCDQYESGVYPVTVMEPAVINREI